MQRYFLILAILLTFNLIVCGETNSSITATSSWQNVKSNASQSWQDIKQTLGSTKDYSFEKKDEFVAKAKTDLKALDAKIKDLSNKASNSNGESKTNTQTRLDKLREQRSALNKKLKEAKSATAENWEKAKTGFKNGYDDAKASVKDVWQWVTDKVSR